MASSYSPAWRRFLNRWMPFLFRRCNQGNYHWRTDVWCYCGQGSHCIGGPRPWHGGIEYLRTGQEYHHPPRDAREQP